MTNSHLSRSREFKKPLWIVLLVLGLGVLAVLIFALTLWRPASSPTVPDISPIRTLAASDIPRLVETLDMNMVRVEAGEFLMGSNSNRDNERPQHSVYLDAYDIGRYEITNAQYARFVQATQRTPPPYWSNNTYPSGQADYPVVGVVWEDADAYCKWAGARLPTEAEWEKACRGTSGQIYPWGNTWDASRVNIGDIASAFPVSSNDTGDSEWNAAWNFLRITRNGTQKPGLQPVGSYPAGASPYGVLDMVGNASEWVVDWYNWSDYSSMPARNPVGLGPTWNHCLRGSAWYDPVGNPASTEDMSRCSARSSSHAGPDPRLGFRCARSVTAAQP